MSDNELIMEKDIEYNIRLNIILINKKQVHANNTGKHFGCNLT